MLGTLEFEETQKKEKTSPDLYNGMVFSDSKKELNFLQRLQTATGELDGVKWDRKLHFPRMQALENKFEKKVGPSEEVKARYRHLAMLRAKNEQEWEKNKEQIAEFVRLQKLIDQK